MTTYTVTARLPTGELIHLASFQGTTGRDWSDLLEGPVKTEYVRQLVELGHSEKVAERAEFKAVAAA